MSPADSLPGLLALMPSVQSFGSHPPVRASQVPRPISRRALPPTTPAGPAAAPVLSTAGFRLQHSLAAWPPASLRFEAESGSLHIAAHAFASEGSDVRVAPHAAPSATCVHGQVTWLAPFIQLDWPGFAWRSRGRRADAENSRIPQRSGRTSQTRRRRCRSPRSLCVLCASAVGMADGCRPRHFLLDSPRPLHRVAIWLLQASCGTAGGRLLAGAGMLFGGGDEREDCR